MAGDFRGYGQVLETIVTESTFSFGAFIVMVPVAEVPLVVVDGGAVVGGVDVEPLIVPGSTVPSTVILCPR